MEQKKVPEVSFAEVRKFLTNVMKKDSTTGKGLDVIREELSAHFGKPKTFFDSQKDEINDLILETIRDMYSAHLAQTKVKSEPVSATERRSSVTSDDGSPVEASPKRAKVAQAASMTRGEFLAKAPKINVRVEGNNFVVPPKVFSTESCGWNASEKVKIEVDGKQFVCQVGLNCTIVGSKQWKN